jgi:hypothetical protein
VIEREVVKPTLVVKVVSGFAVAIVGLLGVGLFAGSLLGDVRDSGREAALTSQRQIGTIAEVDHLYMESLALATRLFYAGSQEQRLDLAIRSIESTDQQATDMLVAFADEPMSPEAQAWYDRLVGITSWCNKAANDVLGLNLTVLDPSIPSITFEELIDQYPARSDEMKGQLGGLRAQLAADANG